MQHHEVVHSAVIPHRGDPHTGLTKVGGVGLALDRDACRVESVCGAMLRDPVEGGVDAAPAFVDGQFEQVGQVAAVTSAPVISAVTAQWVSPSSSALRRASCAVVAARSSWPDQVAAWAATTLSWAISAN